MHTVTALRYDKKIFIVHSKAERVSLIYRTVPYTENIMEETKDKKKTKKISSTRSSQKTVKLVLRKEKRIYDGSYLWIR